MYANGQCVRGSRVIAYALYTLSATNDASGGKQATGNRAALAKKMSPREIDAAQNLTRKMTPAGNLLKMLDQYAKHPID
jgi:hypothetical protein